MKKKMTCLGKSMHPTLRPGDLLEVMVCDRVRQGDVVVYLPPGGDQYTVHRVISVDDLGIRTRGDNNRNADPDVIQRKDVLGWVIRRSRGKSCRRVLGGPSGRIYALFIRVLHRMDRLASARLGPTYYRLSHWGFFRRLVPSALKPRILSIGQGEAQELLMFMGRRMVGRRRSGMPTWEIHRPYRLFIDTSRLPDQPVDV
jgi:hypothetical protein